MRFVLLAFLLMSVSCGQKNSSNSSDKQQGQNEDYITNIQGVDLLDVAVDVPVEISGNKVIFKQTVGDSAAGVRSNCSIGVTSGESYNYTLSGDSLLFRTSSGQSMKFSRVSGNGGSIIGSWSGKTYQSGQLIMRRMTFVSESRMILRTHCET